MEIITKQVGVTYHPTTDQFSYDPPAPDVAFLPGDQAGDLNYAVIFTLSGATWADEWITWKDDPAPPLQQGATLPVLSDPAQRVLGVNNNNNNGTSPETFGFFLHVMSDGTARHSPDPDIVLDPP